MPIVEQQHPVITPVVILQDAINLQDLLPKELNNLALTGTGEGSRNEDCFRLAAVTLAIADAAHVAGLRVNGTPEQVVLDFASRCSPPFDHREALVCLRSAEGQPRTADPGWPERLRYHLNKQAKEQKRLAKAKPSVDTPVTPDDVDIVQTKLYSKNADYLPQVIKGVFQYPNQPWICHDEILHCWNGKYYEPRTDAQLTPLLVAFLSQLEAQDGKEGGTIHPWARPRYVAESLAWMKATLGTAEVNPPNAINCSNGIVSWSWSDGRFHLSFTPHTADTPFTYVTDYDYDPEASPENMLRLLEAVEPTDQDTLQRILGSSLDLGSLS